MLTQRSVIKIEIQKKVYEFHCDSDSPLGSVHDALMQMKGWCLEKMLAAHQHEQEKPDEES